MVFFVFYALAVLLIPLAVLALIASLPILRQLIERPTFSLSTAFTMMTVVSLAMVIGSGMGRKLDLTQTWSTLPADDSALAEWCRKQPELRNWSVRRSGQRVSIHQFSPFYWPVKLQQHVPPWFELGYDGCQGTQLASGDTFRLRPDAVSLGGCVLVFVIASHAVRSLRNRSASGLHHAYHAATKAEGSEGN